MSMSTTVQAFRNMDGEFSRMMEAKLWCEEHNLSYPAEVQAYFGDSIEESETYLRDELSEVDLDEDVLTEYTDEHSQGYEVDVERLPKDVKTLRFTNSW